MTIQQLFRTLVGRIWIIALTTVLAVASSYYLTRLQPSVYTAFSTIIIDTKEPTTGMTSLPAALRDQYHTTQLGILVSPYVIQKAIDQIGYINQPDMVNRFAEEYKEGGDILNWLTNYFLSKVSVTSDRDSWLVTVAYTDEDSKISAEFVNALVDAYIGTVLELDTEPARKSAAWIDQQLAEFRENLESAHTRLTSYQREKGILGVTDDLDVEVERLKALTKEAISIQSDLHGRISRLNQLENFKADDEALYVIPEISLNPYILDLRRDALLKEAELADMSSEFGKRHPSYQREAAEIKTIRARLREEIQRTVNGLSYQIEEVESRLATVEKARDDQREKLIDLKQESGDLPALLREVDSAQRNYDEVLASSQHFKIQSRVNQTNVTILNRATVPPKPSGPNKKKNLAMAILLGLISGIALAILLEIKDRRIRSKQDAVDASGRPLLGILR